MGSTYIPDNRINKVLKRIKAIQNENKAKAYSS